MVRIKLIVEYDGSNYGGWQVQNNTKTIQGTIEDAIFKITQKEIRIHGAGRTDAGVHAIGQVCHFDIDSAIPPSRFAKAINRYLPKDISIVDSREISANFHARFSAIGKSYRYIFIDNEYPSPLNVGRAWHIKNTLDIELLKEGAKHFLGEHDFVGFMSSGSRVKDTCRRINSLKIYRKDRLIIMDISGNGFLYNMVRIIAGTLKDVGEGRYIPHYIEKIILSKDRNMAGITAPAHGLYMMEVMYSSDNDGF